jgi:precorrin-6A synthase
MSRELLLIGIGAGDPDWITLEAVRAIGRLDVVFVVVKEGELDDLVDARRAIIERHRDAPLRTVELQDPPRPWRTAVDYDAAVALWREQRRQLWGDALERELGAGQVGGFLVWGDPSLYESTLAIASELVDLAEGSEAEPISLRVLPGISAVHALTARHGVPLNRQGRAVQIAPARLLRSGMPDGVDDVVVMLDPDQTFARIDPAGIDIYWGAYLGTPDEILIAGPLVEVRDRILSVRADAVARKGWVFDTYLLRRRDGAS